MVDEIYDRAYQSARAQMHADIGGLFSAVTRTLGDSLNTLHRIEWSAPWHRAAKRQQCK